MIKEIPILFKTPMVQAILEGRKTQTRRILKLTKNIEKPEFGYTVFTPDRSISVRGMHGGIFGESFIKPDSKGYFPDYVSKKFGIEGAVSSYHTLWQSINGFESWEENPYVWVISFTKT